MKTKSVGFTQDMHMLKVPIYSVTRTKSHPNVSATQAKFPRAEKVPHISLRTKIGIFHLKKSSSSKILGVLPPPPN